MTYSCPLDDVAWPVRPAHSPLPEIVGGQIAVQIVDENDRPFACGTGTTTSSAYFMAHHIAAIMNKEAEDNGEYDPLNQQLEREGRI